MKICFLSDPRYLHTQRWARFLAERGHEVHIIGGRVVDHRPSAEIPIHFLDDAKFRGPWILRTTLALARLLREVGPDILHMHYLAGLPAPVFLMFRPFVVSVWGADILGEKGLAVEGRKVRVLKTLVLRRAHAVLASSSFLAAATRRYAGLRPSRVSVYPWGVDLNQFQPVPRAGSSPGSHAPIVIGLVKHLEPKYGVEYLLRAIPGIRARHPAIRVVIVGNGSLRAQLEHMAASLSVSDVVSFCGEVSHEQVPRYMADMDIFVMPGGVPEAVLENRSALLVPPRDPGALSQAVVRLIEDPELRRSMSREGRGFVERCYDWRRNAGRVEALYAQLLSRSPAAEGD